MTTGSSVWGIFPVPKYLNLMKLTLPHDWSIEGEFDRSAPTLCRGGFLPAGIGWYRKNFYIPAGWKGKRIVLRFGAIFRCAEIWINGQKVGARANGYVEQLYDVTDQLRFDEDNVVAVRVDNSLQPASRYYTGSGIYRDVWIRILEDVSIARGYPFAVTIAASEKRAVISVQYAIENTKQVVGEYTLKLALSNKGGSVVWCKSVSGNLDGSPCIKGVTEARIENPKLWNTEDPYLYLLSANLQWNDVLCDHVEYKCGIRTTEFTKRNGFYLNGKPVRINGVCLHQDNGCLGAVANETSERRKLMIMKSMGSNAVRVAHSPVSESFLNLCDELGILVMDEMFDEWFTAKTMLALRVSNSDEKVCTKNYAPFFNESYERDLQETILRDRCHPCVIAYSIGNELPEQRLCIPEGVTTAHRMRELVRALDVTRPVTCACCFDMPGTKESHFQDQLDLVGYNYAEALYDVDLNKYPNRKIIGSETTSTTPFWKRGEYDLSVLSNIQRAIVLAQGESISTSEARFLSAEYSMRKHQESKAVAGMFIWAGMDYLGEPTPYAWPSRSSYFGVTDTCGFPKDAFYFYQSRWTVKPMIHLFPHWNWEGKEGQVINLQAYTNCKKAELFLNGVSQGICAYDPVHGERLHWAVPYEPGELLVKAYDDAEEVCAVDCVRTAGKPARIKAVSEVEKLSDDELAYIMVRVEDEKGTLVPVGSSAISFQVESGLEIVGVDNGDPTYLGRLKADCIPTLAGMCLCVVKSVGEKGSYRVFAECDGLLPGSVEIICN